MKKIDLEEFEKGVSVLPMFVEDKDEVLSEIVTCISVDRIQDELNERMPYSLTLIRKFEDGRSYTAKYEIQE